MDVHTFTFAMEWKGKIIIRTEHTTILTDIITTARVYLKTARAGDAVKHSNQDYHKIASNICMQKNTKYNYMQARKKLKQRNRRISITHRSSGHMLRLLLQPRAHNYRSIVRKHLTNSSKCHWTNFAKTH